jgi:HEAT repeat protein
MNTPRPPVGDDELKTVIADFIDQGLVENIVIMFRRDSRYFAWTGDLLRDPRLSVRLGLSVLFEELKLLQPDKLELAIPSLAELLATDQPLLRGEALSLLGIIGGKAAENLARRHLHDPDPQVREMAQLVLEDLA